MLKRVLLWSVPLVVMAGALSSVVRSQDATTDLALLMRGVIPRVAVTVDSATTFAISPRFPWAFIQLACTGAEAIDTITGGRAGTVLYIQHDDTDCTLNDDNDATAANALDLTGSANDVGAVGKVIVLLYTGSYWLEVAESDN